jgi:protein ImuB
MKRMMCVWLPNWPVQRQLNARPELKRQALVLHTVSGRRGPEVVAASRTASDLGITPEIPVAEARALAGITSINGGVQFEIHDPWADRASLKTLAHWCQQFTPVFGIDDTDQPDSLLLDLSGCVHLFGSEQRLGAQVVRSFAAKGYFVQVAIADTISAAWAVARFGCHDGGKAGCPEIRCSRARESLAEQPEDRQGLTTSPTGLRVFDTDDVAADSVFVVASNHSMAALDRLPLSALRICDRSITTLQQLGIHTIRQLRSLPRQDLPSRFGDEIVKRIEQALGRRSEVFEPERPPEPIEAEWSDDDPIKDPQAISFVVQQLVERISETLQTRYEGARELVCRLDSESGSPIRFSVGMLRPENECKHLQELVEMRLESLQLPGPVCCIRIRAIATALQVSRQKQLFSVNEEADQSIEFGLLINRLSNRMGTETILRSRLVADVQPERAAMFTPLIRQDGSLSNLNSSTTTTAILALPPVRPTRLLPEPVSISVSVETDDIVPHCIVWRGCQLTVADFEGPERIDSGWWRDVRIRRDYFRWNAETGQRLWVFHCRQSGGWFVHGLFE